jgi:hypothetical protein
MHGLAAYATASEASMLALVHTTSRQAQANIRNQATSPAGGLPLLVWNRQSLALATHCCLHHPLLPQLFQLLAAAPAAEQLNVPSLNSAAASLVATQSHSYQVLTNFCQQHQNFWCCW